MPRRQPNQKIAPTYEECIGTDNNAVDPLLDEALERLPNIAVAVSVEDQDVNAEFVRRDRVFYRPPPPKKPLASRSKYARILGSGSAPITIAPG